MDNLAEIIKDYLLAENTDYAIMINGDWGCGKTYYIQNTIFKKISEVKSQVKKNPPKQKWLSKSENNPNFKPYEPVYISLYGLSSVDNIYSRILSSLFPFLQNKVFSAITAISNRLLKSKDIDGISEDERKTLESFVGIASNKVLFFDDLERISKNLDIQEVLGFLNTYTEHKKLKVIIICNDEKLPKDYIEFKEKTVRFTYNYQASIDLVYDNILSNFKSTEYRTFLSANKATLIRIFESAKYSNLRTLRFILETFQKIFNAVTDTEYKNQILERLFFFTTIYSVEYKEGVAKEDLDSLFRAENYFSINPSSFLGKNKEKEEEKEPEYFEKFCDKYENIRSSFYYYPAIANYIHFGYIPEVFEFLIETVRNDIKKDEESEDAVSLKKLKNWELIESGEFNDLIEHILGLVDKCKFNLYTYPAIYAQLIQLEYMQIEKFKLTDGIKSQFFNAIDKSKKTHKFEYTFNRRIPLWDNTDKSGAKDRYQEIYNYALHANEEVGNLEYKNEIDKFVEMVSSNNIEGLEGYMNNINNKDIIKNITAETLFEKLLLAKGTTIKMFVHGIYAFYPDNSLYSLSDEEIAFFKRLDELIDDYFSKTEKRPIESAFLFYLKNKVKSILTRNTYQG